jgi:hypothetical protein
VRVGHGQTSAEPVTSAVSSATVHPVLRLQHLCGNRHVQRLIQDQRQPSSSGSQIARKAPDGGSCSSAPSEEEAAQAQQEQAQDGQVAEEEPTVMAMPIRRSPLIQRYGLVGFPAAEKAKMEAAIPVALDTVENCDDIGWLMTKSIKSTLRGSFYVYKPDMDLCGWTFPASPYIEVGKTAFDPGPCCKLESTLAHEASHVNFKTESGAREMEKDCFGCS